MITSAEKEPKKQDFFGMASGKYSGYRDPANEDFQNGSAVNKNGSGNHRIIELRGVLKDLETVCETIICFR